MEQLMKLFEYIRKHSYIFLVAALVEAPRLVYSFGAFRENWFAALSLALLSTYALSLTFENYFSHRNRIMLLILGIVSILINLIIVTPVISFLLQNAIDDVNLVKIFGDNQYLIFIYAGTVTLSTFWPLILIGAVKGYDFVENLKRTITITNNDHNVYELNFSNELLALSNLISKLEQKIEALDSKVDGYTIGLEKRFEEFVASQEKVLETTVIEPIEKKIKQKKLQSESEDSSEEVALSDEILKLLKESPKTVEELSNLLNVELKVLENGPRWGILRKLTKNEIIKKNGIKYELVNSNVEEK